MDDSTLKNLLSRLSKQAFEAFIVELYNSEKFEHNIKPLEEVGDNVFYRGIVASYGQSIHSTFILQYLPIELLKNPEIHLLDDETLIPTLKQLCNFYKGKKGAWGMVSESLRYDYQIKGINLITNLHNVEVETYFEKLIPNFKDIVERIFRRKTIGTAIGSYDSFIELANEHIKQGFTKFLQNNSDGIRISLLSENIKVERFVVEKNLSGGVMPTTKFPYETLFVNYFAQDEILKEFESLINKETSESDLENFLVSNYKEIFGNKYDRIETQLWLKFPEFDISDKNRRLDVFLRNSVVNDWELFEVKRIIELSRNYRDIPVLSKEISYAIHQIKNYARILSQDSVKRHFSTQGIGYFEPSLNIVVGSKPQISHEQWRWLTSNDKSVNILTFDNLLEEMKYRLSDRKKFLIKK